MAIHNSTTSELTDVQDAYNLCVDGDTLGIPAGNSTWAGSLACTKNINIIGAGMGLTNLTGKSLIRCTTKLDAPAGTVTTPEVRVSGVTLIADNLGVSGAADASLWIGGFSQNIRLDHIGWKNFTKKPNGPDGLWVAGWTFGVMDHCTVDEDSSPVNELLIFNHPTDPTGVPQFGDYSWAQPVDYNGAGFWFVEDCIFFNHPFCAGTLGGTSGGGSRYVFRHNTSYGGGGGGHGTESNGRGRSLRATQSYNNYYDGSKNTGGESSLNYRGGCGNIFNNRYTGYATNTEVSVEDFRCAAQWATFNSGDGTGPWDDVDRSSDGPLGVGTGVDDGSGLSTRSKIYASGTGGSVNTTTGLATLPGLSCPTGNCWAGYTLRAPDGAYSGATSNPTKPPFFALISGNSAGGNTVQTIKGNSGYMKLPTLSASDAWEIRRNLQMLDAPGTGHGDTQVTGPNTAPVLVSGTPNPRWTNQPREGIYQWGNKSRATSGGTFTTSPGFAGWATKYLSFLQIGRDLFENTVRPGFTEITSPTNDQLRIGADWSRTDPGGQVSPASINVGDPGAATQAWGFVYPHPLRGGSVGKIIGLSGSMAFGNVIIGQTPTSTLHVANLGDALLTVNGVSYPTGFTGATGGFTVAIGATHDIVVTFTPIAETVYSGNITASSDAGSGINTLACSGTGVAPAGGGGHGKGHKKGTIGRHN